MNLLELIARNFVKIQFVLFIVGVFVCLRMLSSTQSRSHFRAREADRSDLTKLREGPDLAEAKLRPKHAPKSEMPPLALPGIRLSGEPHEILGVDEDASEVEIMRAYKDAIKRFHPDRIQGQAKEQIQFYEQASAKLNQAKDDLLKSTRSRKG